MPKRTIREILTETKILYKFHVPQILEQKLPVQTLKEAELSDWENDIGAKMPEDFRSYLGLCNFYIQLQTDYSTLSGAQSREIWQQMNAQLNSGEFEGLAESNEIELNNFGIQERIIQEAWWHRMWIPFAIDINGNLKCVDLAPQRQGHHGQILEMNIKDGIGPYITDYENFSDFLNSQLECLIKEQYKVVNGDLSLDSNC